MDDYHSKPKDLQCCAIAVKGERCVMPSLDNSNHCNIHYSVATSLYAKYKKLENELVKLKKIIKNTTYKSVTEQLKYLIKYYVLLNNVYNARLRHRKYSFSPECYDEGHNYRLHKIKNKIEKYETKIYQLRIEESFCFQKLIIFEEEEEIEVEEDNFNHSVHNQIEICKNNREEYEKEVNSIMNDYKIKNEIIIREKEKLIIHVTNAIIQLYDYDCFCEDIDNCICICSKISPYVCCVVAFNIIYELYNINYFNNEFKKINYDNLILFHITIEENNTIYKYFNFVHETLLKTFYKLILFHRAQLFLIIEDIKSILEVYENNALFINYKFIWNNEQNRLQILSNDTIHYPKIHNVQSLLRLKQPYKNQKIKEFINNYA